MKPKKYTEDDLSLVCKNVMLIFIKSFLNNKLYTHLPPGYKEEINKEVDDFMFNKYGLKADFND